MTYQRLIRSELRKLVTTKMPLAFVVVLAVIAAVNAFAVVSGTDADGSKDFISTAGDQRSLIAFAANAMMISGLFGAIAAAREYGHGTVVPTFLASPRRVRIGLAQLVAASVGGAVLGFVGTALTAAAVAISLPTTEYGFLVSAPALVRVLAAASFAGGAGAVLGAGIGTLVRNTGGAVTGAVLALVIAPPLIVQFASGAASWVPGPLALALSGVTEGVAMPSALVGLATWAAVPAALGLVSMLRRDVV